jgi:hypothetical protein
MSFIKHQNLEIHIERKSRAKIAESGKNSQSNIILIFYNIVQPIRVSNYEMAFGRQIKLS